MPRAPARIRKRFIEGTTEVLDHEMEECLVYGYPLVLDTLASLRTIDEWRAAWSRWRDTVLPKVLEHRPGTRPAAMYVLGEIPRRELRINVPDAVYGTHIDVRGRDGKTTRHWLAAPPTFLEPEVTHLHRLGIVNDEERARHRQWRQRGGDPYPLEVSLYE